MQTGAGALQADHYVAALGSFTPRMLKPLGLRLPVYPVKGYSITVPIGVPMFLAVVIATGNLSAVSHFSGQALGLLALAGVLIALKAAGSAIGWGFQLQSPPVVAVLALLILAVLRGAEALRKGGMPPRAIAAVSEQAIALIPRP